MSTTHTDEIDEKHTNNLRYEGTIRLDRDLTHEADEPDALRTQLERLNIDGKVTVERFTDQGAVVILEVEEPIKERLAHSFAKQLRRAVRNYNRQTSGDDLEKVPLPRGMKKSYVQRAYDNEERPSHGTYFVPTDKWDKAKEIAETLDLEGAPGLGVEVHVRTLPGAPAKIDL